MATGMFGDNINLKGATTNRVAKLPIDGALPMGLNTAVDLANEISGAGIPLLARGNKPETGRS